MKTETKHTAGPWRIEPNVEDPCYSLIIADGWIGLAKVVTSVYKHDGFDVAESDVPEPNETGIANAHLIAAAPQMYEALEELLKAHSTLECKHDGMVMNMARAALTAARGGREDE